MPAGTSDSSLPGLDQDLLLKKLSALEQRELQMKNERKNLQMSLQMAQVASSPNETRGGSSPSTGPSEKKRKKKSTEVESKKKKSSFKRGASPPPPPRPSGIGLPGGLRSGAYSGSEEEEDSDPEEKVGKQCKFFSIDDSPRTLAMRNSADPIGSWFDVVEEASPTKVKETKILNLQDQSSEEESESEYEDSSEEASEEDDSEEDKRSECSSQCTEVSMHVVDCHIQNSRSNSDVDSCVNSDEEEDLQSLYSKSGKASSAASSASLGSLYACETPKSLGSLYGGSDGEQEENDEEGEDENGTLKDGTTTARCVLNLENLAAYNASKNAAESRDLMKHRSFLPRSVALEAAGVIRGETMSESQSDLLTSESDVIQQFSPTEIGTSPIVPGETSEAVQVPSPSVEEPFKNADDLKVESVQPSPVESEGKPSDSPKEENDSGSEKPSAEVENSASITTAEEIEGPETTASKSSGIVSSSSVSKEETVEEMPSPVEEFASVEEPPLGNKGIASSIDDATFALGLSPLDPVQPSDSVSSQSLLKDAFPLECPGEPRTQTKLGQDCPIKTISSASLPQILAEQQVPVTSPTTSVETNSTFHLNRRVINVPEGTMIDCVELGNEMSGSEASSPEKRNTGRESPVTAHGSSDSLKKSNLLFVINKSVGLNPAGGLSGATSLAGQCIEEEVNGRTVGGKRLSELLKRPQPDDLTPTLSAAEETEGEGEVSALEEVGGVTVGTPCDTTPDASATTPALDGIDKRVTERVD